jgi:molybdopterin-binding protein
MARHLSSTEVCHLLEISPKTLYAWERTGKIPKSRRDRRGWRMFTPGDVEKIRRFAGPPARRGAEAAARRERKSLAGLTARNQIRGTVVSITSDGVLAEVVLRLPDGQEVVSVVTRSSVRRLGLKKGQPAMAVIKATEVMLFA